ncbi:transcriptional regulator [Nocardioides sp. J2M5]|uniref:helix-turn-helix domain-containing protein n=1 Tax=Nocardioides palaemonis TaxID=2829810 RepID=UPI001BA47C9F|nr:helix-turn-helix domain-containing protein [Nocardioides palaemonis]MBS2940051.1 transcriptional regulator [Nocardioides palaemonis]
MSVDSMRAHVADSWHLSAAAGVDAEAAEAPITLDAGDLRDHRSAHPLARVFPLLDDVLGQAARECGAIMAVSDAAGQLLWVCGTPSTLRRAESIGFVEGSNWDERMAGTNAPGMALRLGQTVLVRGSEHFRRSVQPWSCAATPILDPTSSSLLGVLDVTGGDDIAVPQTTAMVRAAARMAEAELARDLLTGRPEAPRSGPGLQVGVELLGRHEALLTVSPDGRSGTTLRLTPRHSEIVLLLGTAPHGLSGDELAVLLYEDDGASSTLRAELNRLRHLLGDELLVSRPYRLAAAVAGDWLAVEARLAAGDLRGALRAYRGPVLPRSTAPGVVRLREQLHHSVRGGLLACREPDLMASWTRSAWGADDYEMWLAQLDVVAATSPVRALVEGQVARLDRELG